MTTSGISSMHSLLDMIMLDRSDLVNRITQCAEKFASSHGWYVSTMVRVFYLAGDKIKSNVAQTLMQLIAEGEGRA